MNSGSWASYISAAPLEVYPGEPGDDCPHGVPDGISCPECKNESLKEDLRTEQDEADYWFDRYQEMAVIADALAAAMEE